MTLTKILLHILTVLVLLGFPAGHESQANLPQLSNSQSSNSRESILEGSSASIYSDYLDNNIPGLPPEQITYHLTQAPAYGSLLQGTVPISIGDTFSQLDVNQGQLHYVHDGSETSHDQFGYSVASIWSGTRRIAVVSDGSISPVRELIPSISADGLWAAYVSGSVLTISGKTTQTPEIFLSNLQTGEIIRVNLGIHGAEPDADSFLPYLSADGRFLAFTSRASNLVENDIYPYEDTFIYDRITGQTQLVSITPDGQPLGGGYAFGVSSNGDRVLFTYSDHGDMKLMVKDIPTGELIPITPNALGETVRWSDWAAISGDGNSVVFDSDEAGLVPGDTNDASDIFVFNIDTGVTERANLRPDGTQTMMSSYNPSISDDGRFIVFQSTANDLVINDNNAHADVFVRDRQDGQTSRVPIDSLSALPGMPYGFQAKISSSGRFITFTADVPDADNIPAKITMVFTFDQLSNQLWMASQTSDGIQANGNAIYSDVSDHGSTLFFSHATNLDPLQIPNGYYLHTHGSAVNTTGIFPLEIVPVDDFPVAQPGQTPETSGSVPVPITQANLPVTDADSPPDQLIYTLTQLPEHGVMLKNNQALGLNQSFTQADVISGEINFQPDQTWSGSEVLDLTLTNRGPLLDYIPRAADGTPANNVSDYRPAVSADGRYIAFSSYADNLIAGDTNEKFDIFVKDTLTGTIEKISIASEGQQANGDSVDAAISADGQFVAFWSLASNLVPGDTNNCRDVFLFDRQKGQIERVSVDSWEQQANGHSEQPALSADGRFVAFMSFASNLADNDLSMSPNIFVRDRMAGMTERITNPPPNQSYAMGEYPSISADGRYIAFSSNTPGLVENDTDYLSDVFVYDRAAHSMAKASTGPQGLQANGVSFGPTSISADGSQLIFLSYAANLVTTGQFSRPQMILHNFRNGSNQLISTQENGDPAACSPSYPSISYNGERVASIGCTTDQPLPSKNQKILLREWQPELTWAADTANLGESIDGYPMYTAISANASVTTFVFWPDPGDISTNGLHPGVYAWRGPGQKISLTLLVRPIPWVLYLPITMR